MRIGVIGGGPAGVFTALNLRKKGFEVCVFEASNFGSIRAGEHLAAEALHEFKKVGVPVSVLLENSIPCTEVRSLWGNDEMQYNESVFNPFGDGFILSRPDFDKAILDYTETLGVTVVSNTRISKIVKEGKQWVIENKRKKKQTVDFVVDASGRNSKFQFDSLGAVSIDELIGVSRVVKPISDKKVASSYLLIEPVSNGWWYTVQLASGELVATFMTDAIIMSSDRMTKENFWELQLEGSIATKKRLSGFLLKDKCFVQSAQSQISEKIVGESWLKVGDSAISFDPLSSAGILKGFKTAQLAAGAIEDLYKGNTDALKVYELELKGQYDEYIEKKEEYYEKELRWMEFSFWYQRNLKPQKIDCFTVYPKQKYQINTNRLKEKCLLLKNVFKTFELMQLLDVLEENSSIEEAITGYFNIVGKKREMSLELLQVLESLKLLKVLVFI